MRTSVTVMDWAIWLIVRGDELKGALRQMFMFIVLDWGHPISKHTSKGFRVRGALSYGAEQAVIQLGMSLPERQLPN